MPTITTAARNLRPGDVLLEPLPTPVGGSTRYAVLDVAVADPGPVGVQLARLGHLPAHLDRVATVAWPADAVLEVVRSRPTLEQAQRAAATLHEGLAAVARGEFDPSMLRERHEARALLELRQSMALRLLEDVERLAAGGYAARVRIQHDELEVSAEDVHASVEQAVRNVRAEAWHKLEDERDRLLEERDNLAAELLELRNCAP